MSGEDLERIRQAQQPGNRTHRDLVADRDDRVVEEPVRPVGEQRRLLVDLVGVEHLTCTSRSSVITKSMTPSSSSATSACASCRSGERGGPRVGARRAAAGACRPRRLRCERRRIPGRASRARTSPRFRTCNCSPTSPIRSQQRCSASSACPRGSSGRRDSWNTSVAARLTRPHVRGGRELVTETDEDAGPTAGRAAQQDLVDERQQFREARLARIEAVRLVHRGLAALHDGGDARAQHVGEPGRVLDAAAAIPGTGSCRRPRSAAAYRRRSSTHAPVRRAD